MKKKIKRIIGYVILILILFATLFFVVKDYISFFQYILMSGIGIVIVLIVGLGAWLIDE